MIQPGLEMNDAVNAAHQKAVNTVKRLGLDCSIQSARQGWKKQLLVIAGKGTAASITRLAEALQADILTQLPEATTDWLDFELCIASDDTA